MAVDPQVGLVELAELKTFLGVSGVGQDRILEECIEAVSDDLRGYTDRAILSADFTQRFDGDCTDLLILPQYPITAVTLLKPYKDGPALVLDTDFVIHKPEIGHVRLLNSRFPRSIMGITCTWTAGYTKASIPRQLRWSILEAAGKLFQEADKKLFAVKSEQKGEITVYYVRAAYGEHVAAVWDREIRLSC